MGWGVGIALILAVATIALAQTDTTQITSIWDWPTFITACTAAGVALLSAVNTLQNTRIKWRQQQAADALAATQVAVLQGELLARKADASLQVVVTQLDGVVLQLNGKLTAQIKKVREAAHAAGVLEERTRWEKKRRKR